MFSLPGPRIMRCRFHFIPLVLLCVSGFPLCAQDSRSAAAFDNASVSPLVIVPQQTSPAPINPVLALSPEQQGDLLMARQQYSAALHAYQQGPFMTAVVWNKIGIAYHHLLAFNQAQRAYRIALKLNPRYPEALNNLAAIYYAKGKYKRAEHTYRHALDYQPAAAAIIYSNLGTSYIAEKKYKQAQQAYQTAIILDPNVFNNPHGSSLFDEASPREQLRAIDYYLACAFAKAGRKDEALNYLRRAFGEGLGNRQRLLADKDFDPIRASPEFQQLLLERHFD